MNKKTNSKTKVKPGTKQNFVIALTNGEVQQLNMMLGEIPAKFANPLFEFFNLVQKQRIAEQTPPPPDGPPVDPGKKA